MSGHQRLRRYLIWRGSISAIVLLSLLITLSALADLIAHR